MSADLRLAWRRLIKAPGFTVTAVMILTFAIGANAAVFSIADAALFRPLPYRDADSLYLLRTMDQRTGKLYGAIPLRFLQAINQRRPRGCEVGIYERARDATIVTNGEADSMRKFAVTDNYFRLFGIRPAGGRLFDAGDVNSSGQSAMLSYATWQKRFGGDEQIVGRPIKIGSVTYDIVGILPSGFLFPSLFQEALELVTVMPQPALDAPGGAVDPVLRLGPGVTREQA